jgi:Rieske 2Fe-2S family protein
MLKTGLPREYFVSPELYEQETDRVFARNWVCVGHLAEFPPAPAYRVLQIGSYSIVVSRPAADEVHAFHNICRHRGARLCNQPEGELKNRALTCPYHAWTYDAQGRLIGAPNMADQPDFRREDFPLVPVAAACWNGFVMLHMQADAADFAKEYKPLSDRLANWVRDELQLIATLRYNVRGNWKLLFQNYSECYHCPTVHPELLRLTSPRSATNDLIDGNFLGGPMVLNDGCETVSQDGKLVSKILPALSESQHKHVCFYTVFPTLFVSPHPDYVMVHVLNRKNLAETEVACHFLLPQAIAQSSKVDMTRATAMWDEINRQDWEMCALTQFGVESPAYRPGPYSTSESMVAAFDNHYLEVMDR